MPKVKFLVSVPGDSQNRSGWNVGDTVWVGADEAARRVEAGEVKVLEQDPGPGKAPPEKEEAVEAKPPAKSADAGASDSRKEK